MTIEMPTYTLVLLRFAMGFDNDCNGQIDDNPSDIIRYYFDGDSDGFGIESQSELACPADKSDGYIEVKIRNGIERFDCNDDDPSIHPDALEICDLLDNDCDEVVDVDVDEGAPLWYADTDGDGHGNFDDSLRECPDENGNSPSGYVNNFSDCDDSSSDIYPNAPEFL